MDDGEPRSFASLDASDLGAGEAHHRTKLILAEPCHAAAVADLGPDHPIQLSTAASARFHNSFANWHAGIITDGALLPAYWPITRPAGLTAIKRGMAPASVVK